MVVKFHSKQSLDINAPQFYEFSLLVTMVILINVVIGGFSREDLKVVSIVQGLFFFSRDMPCPIWYNNISTSKYTFSSDFLLLAINF